MEENKAVKKQREIKRDTYTVKGKMSYIRRRLSARKEMSFFDKLFGRDKNKLYILIA